MVLSRIVDGALPAVEAKYAVTCSGSLLTEQLVAYVVLGCNAWSVRCANDKGNPDATQLTKKETTVNMQSMHNRACGSEWARSDFLAQDLGGFVEGADEDGGELGIRLAIRDDNVCCCQYLTSGNQPVSLTEELELLRSVQHLRVGQGHGTQFVELLQLGELVTLLKYEECQVPWSGCSTNCRS